jgi:predicted dehydrogenase
MFVTRSLRAVVVGLNYYHVTGWVESLAQFSHRIEIVGKYDPDPDREGQPGPDHADPHLAQQFPAWFSDVQYYSELDRLIEGQRPDLALVTLPNALAPDAIARLARSGVHMLVDKPGARTASEGRSAFTTAREAGVKVAVGLTRRYGRPWQDAAAAVRSGRLGRLLTAEAMFVTSSVAVRDPANAIFSRELMGGGILHWLGIHDIDLLLWLAGEPIAEVQAMAANCSDTPIDVEDTISVAFRYEGGALGTMHFAYALRRTGGEGYLALRGSAASIRIDAGGTTTWIGPGNVHDPVLTQTSSVEMARASGYGSVGNRIIDDLLAAIEEDRDPLATGEQIVSALEVVDAIYEATRTGARMKVKGVKG